MKLRGFSLIAATAIVTTVAMAAFTRDTFRTLQTTVSASTTNLCTNVTINVSEFDSIGLQFAGSLAKVGEGSVEIKFKRGMDTNAIDSAVLFTWTIDTAAWPSNTVTYASTNIASIADFYTLSIYSIANVNTSALSSVALTYGSQ